MLDQVSRKVSEIIQKHLADMNVTINFGMLGADFNTKYPDSPATTGYVALLHEYGLGGMPKRSFMRSTLELEEKNIARLTAEGSMKYLASNYQDYSGLVLAGQYGMSRIRERVMNKEILQLPSTNRRQRKDNSSVALKDTGVMMSMLSFEIMARGKLIYAGN